MASQKHQSLLLTARPHMVGVARGGDFSIFLETLQITGLYSHLKAHAINLPVSQDEDVESSESEGHSSGIQPCSASNHVGREVQTCFVIDRAGDGSVKEVPYKFSATTITLFQMLHNLKIPFETEIYKPKEDRLCVPGNVFYCKNLFLKDRKGQFYLVICHEDLNINLRKLCKSLNAYRNFNFGTADDMKVILGTEPGGVTPLGLMKPAAASVKMVIHSSLTKEEAWLMFHPLDSRLATKITLPSLLRFLQTYKHQPVFVKDV